MNRRFTFLILALLWALPAVLCGFMLDFSPPAVLPNGLYPPPDTVMNEANFNISAALDDSGAGVWTDSVVMTVVVNGTDTAIHTGLANIEGSFSSGDSVEVCIRAMDEIYDTLACTCPANVMDSCWSFTVFSCASGPFARVTYPDSCGYITSCTNQGVEWAIRDTCHSIDTSSIRVHISVSGGLEYDALMGVDSRLVWDGDSILSFTPSLGEWSNGDTVTVTLDSVDNTFGSPLENAVVCPFVVDTAPPFVLIHYPADGETIRASSVNAAFIIFDSVAGCWTDSTRAVAEIWRGGSLFDSDTFDSGEPMNITALESGDSVKICIVRAMDYPDYDYCPPNEMMDYCWRFYIAFEGPYAWLIEPDDSNYDSTTVSACSCQSIIIGIYDKDGVDSATIHLEVEETEYAIPDLELSWDGDSILTFTPLSSCWQEGLSVNFELIAANDGFGFPLATTLADSFVIDREGPYFFDAMPIGVFHSPDVNISISASDFVCGDDIIPDSRTDNTCHLL